MDRFLFRNDRLSKAVSCLRLVSSIAIFHCTLSFGQVVPNKPEPVRIHENGQPFSESDYRQAWFDTLYPYTKFVRETGNMRNDHWAIAKMNRELGYPPTSSYCSTSGMWSARVNGMRFKGINGMAYSWRQKDKLVFYPAMMRGNRRVTPMIKKMDAVSFSFSHVEYAVMRGGVIWTPEGIWTIGCNTRGGNNRIEGCYYPIFRPWYMIRGVYNHVTPWYSALPKK